MFPTEDLLKLVKDAGLRAVPQASFYKVQASDGLVLYIGKTNRASRVDFSGFSFAHPAVKRLSDDEAKELKMGRVRGQIDFTKTQERIIEAFRTALAVMKHEAGAGGRAPDVKYHVLEARGGNATPTKRGTRRARKPTVQEPATA